jgi:ribosomal protein S21
MSRAVRVEIKPRFPDEPLERMIKRFNKKVKKERIIENVLNRRYHEKPSEKRRKERRRRKKVVQKAHQKNNTFKER